MNEKQLTRNSKFLSLVLRHKPEAAGVTLDGEGWIDIATLLKGCASHGHPLTREELDYIVENNDKKRFTIEGSRIRAAQGHSLESVKIDYVAIEPPALLYHGTATRFLDPIMKDGLKKMSRTHVHLSETVETARNVGTRHGSVVIIPIKAKEMHHTGYLFFKSDNGVWLTDRVPARFFGELIY